MDLRGLPLGPVNERGYRRVLGGAAVAPPTLQLVPGVTFWPDGGVTVPANLSQAAGWSGLEQIAAATPGGLIRLREYQREGVAFIEQSVKGCVIADDVGVGKTNQVCAYLARHPELRPFLVIGPLIAAGSWVGGGADPARHFDLLVKVLRSTKPDEFLAGEELAAAGADGFFINYDIVKPWLLHLELNKNIRPKVVIVDESHTVRNPRTQEAKAVRRLCRLSTTHKRIFLTATPVVNRVIDLWHQLDCVQPGLWSTYVPHNTKAVTSFGTRYCNAFHDGYGWDVSGESNTAELKHRLSSVMLRRSRFDVRKELPPLDRQRIQLALEALDPVALREYQQAAQAVYGAALNSSLSAAELQRATATAVALSWAKRDVAVTEALGLIRSVSNHKVLIYTWYKKTAQYIAKVLKKKGVNVFGPITGEAQLKKRLNEADAFRDLALPASSSGACFIATMGAAGVALNALSAAAAALFVDLYWVPATLLQAEGRIHREGQQAASVLIRYMIAPKTIDEIMYTMLEKKAAAIAHVTGDQGAQTLAEALGGKNEQEGLKGLLLELAKLKKEDLELL